MQIKIKLLYVAYILRAGRFLAMSEGGVRSLFCYVMRSGKICRGLQGKG